MIYIRSFLFNILFYVWSLIIAVGCTPLLLGPSRASSWVEKAWGWGVVQLARIICGVGYEIRGQHNLPDHPVIVAPKHQSTWETAMMHVLLREPGTVMKRELLMIPFYGWYGIRSGMIPVDRSGHASAMRRMLRAADRIVSAQRPVLIFPEGSRMPPGQEGDYKVGISGLYRHLKVPVVPVALNSGVYWPRRGFLKNPGTIVVEFLPPIEPGLGRKEFMSVLESRLEPATRKLLDEAGYDYAQAQQGLDKTEPPPGED